MGPEWGDNLVNECNRLIATVRAWSPGSPITFGVWGNWWDYCARGYRGRGMKWFYLICFVAGVLACVIVSGLGIFELIIHPHPHIKGLFYFFLFLAFIARLTREVFGFFQEERRAKKSGISN
jgi:hypothetical protein